MSRCWPSLQALNNDIVNEKWNARILPRRPLDHTRSFVGRQSWLDRDDAAARGRVRNLRDVLRCGDERDAGRTAGGHSRGDQDLGAHNTDTLLDGLHPFTMFTTHNAI